MTGRVLRFIPSADAALPPASGVESIVLDTTWTPLPGDRHDVRPLRPLLVGVLRRLDPLAESMERLDDWAAASDVGDRLEVDGFSWWYRRRLVYWRGLHDRLVWRGVITALASEGPIAGLDLTTDLAELREVGEAAAAEGGWAFSAPIPPPSTPDAMPRRRRLPWHLDPILWRLGVHRQRATPGDRDPRVAARRSAAMLERVQALGRDGGRLLVLTAPATHQVVASDGASASRDPFLGTVVELLRGTALEPIVLETGTDPSDDRTWAGLHAAGRERVLPGTVVGRAFDDPDDDAEVDAARRRLEARLAEPFARLDVDGLDLGPWIVHGLRRYATAGFASDLRRTRRIRRLLAVLRPAAVLLVNEYTRTEWLIACGHEGIPVVAVQHGIIHPLHAGYVLPSRVGLPLAARTYLFGDYEARLLTGSSVYRPDEVAVSGSPRLDLVAGVRPDAGARSATRAVLGVAPGERLVVFSSTNSVAVRATVIAAALDTILDQGLPGVHLVVKLHPAEVDDGFYPAFIDGLARARGFAPPPTTIVKAIDLFELLRAADAHLGVYSTVLTDAVAAGTPNLIVTSLAGADLLGYADAGVARPVRSGADLLAALDRPVDSAGDAGAAAARAAFLADHFAAGPSARRIADDLVLCYGDAAGTDERPVASSDHIALRPATMDDAALLLRWANEPSIRAAGFHPAAIDEPGHLRWLAARLESPTTRLFVGMIDGRPVGQLRLERREEALVEVSIGVAQDERGRGAGRQLLAAGIAAGRADPALAVQGFVARVRPDNAASLALFRGAGFAGTAQDMVNGIACVVLRLD